MKPRTIAALIIGALVTILVIQNIHPVVLKVLFWEPEIPLVLLVVIVLIAGFIVGWFTSSAMGKESKKNDDY